MAVKKAHSHAFEQ